MNKMIPKAAAPAGKIKIPKGKVFGRVEYPNKKVHYYYFNKKGFVKSLESAVPTFAVDGEKVKNASKILESKAFSVMMPDGKVASWKRSDKREFVGVIQGKKRAISWSKNFSTIFMKMEESTISFQLIGMNKKNMIRAITAIVVLVCGGVDTPAVLATGGEVIIGVIGIIAIAWMTCAISGTAMCLAMAVATCGQGNVLVSKAQCGISPSSNSYIPDFGFGCIIQCKPNSPNPPKLPPTEPVPFPPFDPPEQIPGPNALGECGEGLRPDICIVGWADVAGYDDSGEIPVVTVERVPISQPCCVPEGVP